MVRPRQRWSLVWLVPVIALALAGWLWWRSWSLRGDEITIHFEQGHGIKVGHALRYRGVKVGEVARIRLADDLSGAEVIAVLLPNAERIARTGTQFWIVRPRIGPSGVTGLETLLGPHYIAVRPGDSTEKRRRFIGLRAPPIVESVASDDLEIILHAESRGSLQAGGPVTYRGIRIGTVLSVGLASDGSAVESRVHIQQAYISLITEQTHFWDAGGVKVDLGFSGLSMELDSLAGLMMGEVAIALPPDAGAPVRTGHRFQLASESRSEWLSWQPTLPIGTALLPAGSGLPTLERARLVYETDTLKIDKSRLGWVLPVDDGFIGPIALITEPEKARNGTGRLEVVGRSLSAPREPSWAANGIGLIRTVISDRPWPRSRMRILTEPEDCVIVAGGADATMPLAAVRLALTEGILTIDEAISFEDSWQGAAILARDDGALVGILIVEEGAGSVALLPESLVHGD